MAVFETTRLSREPDAVAPDGSHVRLLLALGGGSVAHFELGPGRTSVAVAHRTVDEIWYFLAGRGEMWRQSHEHEEVVPVDPGTCITIPVGTRFQFRTIGRDSLAAVAVTMPPWPGDGEAFEVQGKWQAIVIHDS